MNLIGELTILLGSLFILLSAIGIIRMPDFLMRLQAASKASAFGVILILVGGSILIDDWTYEVTAFVIFLFLLISTPIGAHALAQANKKT
jgi:multicomponent Na+:H+ antiporter subunit G